MGVGPSTKETTLHHFRDPLINLIAEDPDIDFLGVVIGGIPDRNVDKKFTGERIGAWLEAMRCDGAIVSEDSWGNSNVDLAAAMEAIGRRDIPQVGMVLIGTQGIVDQNEYMDTMVDTNHSESGTETNIVAENCMTMAEARKCVALLKLKMSRKYGHL
ncbi:MAG: proline reductase [Lachnospiraceae bacterium]|nr:proline reductase [Lachnospiraceae bacterium]